MGTAVPTPPAMTSKVAEYLTQLQWQSVSALKEIDPFKQLTEDLELNVESWREWLEMGNCEEQELPGEWQKKVTPFVALRPDRVTAALTLFISETMGVRYMVQEPFDLETTFEDSSSQTPLFFVLFPGVDPGTEIETLGRKLGFTESAGNFVSISMGQGQERNGESVLDRFTYEGGWAFLQNVHLMQSWLPTLERKLEIAQETGHPDFRCFVTAEPPGLPDQMLIPEGIMQAAIKVANEPPTDVKSLYRSAYALFSQADIDKSSKQVEFKPMLFGLCFFHALVLGRRKFGFQGFSRPYPFNNGDLNVCSAVLHNYLEGNATVPWDDVRYNFGEIMYGGHITDAYDRRITNTYLEVLLEPRLLEAESEHVLAPGYKALRTGEFEDYRKYIETSLPAESPVLFGLHPNSQISLLQTQAIDLFNNIIVLSGGGGSGGGGPSKESKAGDMCSFIKDRLPDNFQMLDIRAKVPNLTPYIVCGLQELERANSVVSEMRRALAELELGLAGSLNISDVMDALISDLALNKVPNLWLKLCGQVGPTGAYNRKALGSWFTDLLLRLKQLKEWSNDALVLPKSIWIAGLFNPMGYVTACMQVTARAKGLPLDSMTVHTEVTEFEPSQVSGQPDEGTYVHGLYMEGARWDKTNNVITDSLPKELHPSIPVLHIMGVTEDEVVTKGVYICPVYTTTIRGPTLTFNAPLRTDRPSHTWILAAVALLMQPDQ
eukprot:CAMPEP_0181237030 /NCGR_PEP_ID=MMETSP1096-20121128/38526_1 /TAXON_ID=156174 ORGANISM="Chrysochromulina ericina, Strain CCMP281" /NCGR_SAMPLE_ID=MMETSP1096 /ASSEMBLY_ACC=CAM_ASM_000453 /LENGTH=717 /DNA_ID=CAMNT_0023332319 /DNA_START=18 /DNA_END=2171 /DNA_ORIENTATION=+